MRDDNTYHTENQEMSNEGRLPFDTSRRGFMQTTGAIGVAGLLGTTAVGAQQSDSNLIELEAVQQASNGPTDPDGDGLYEDVDGDGTVGYNDVVEFFEGLEEYAADDMWERLDYNENDRVDFDDVITLFEEVGENGSDSQPSTSGYAWLGVAPNEIEDQTNPTITLTAGEDYTVEWTNQTGDSHNFVIVDDNGTEVLSSSTMSTEGETQTVEFTASDEMAAYYSESHPDSMRGSFRFRGEEELAIGEEPSPNSFPFVTPENTAPVVIDDSDGEVVNTAASLFADDIELITGSTPEVLTGVPDDVTEVVLAGSVEESDLINRLISEDRFDSSHIDNGQWETYTITVVDDPLEGVDQALVVAGSDPRGTAYGLFEVSQTAGVSPWVWWADAATDDKEAIHVSNGLFEFGPPSVKYRGIFLNDTVWGLLPWASETFEPEYGNIGPKTYSKFFELLLRLKANYLWPAMHADKWPGISMEAFYENFEKQEVADKYGIVIGTAHNEPLLVNPNAWDSDTYGEYNYGTNPDGVKQAWRDRVELTADSENVYQLGMRGQGDRPIAGVDSPQEGAELVSNIISEQRDMLRQYNEEDISSIPQVFTPYKEVLEYYEYGMDIPEDVTIVWPDDNFSHMREYADQEERQRSGGSGAYYHLSYLGFPHPNLLLDSTSPSLTWREMERGMQKEMRNQWIINSGDLKRREWGTEFALDLAWNKNEWTQENILSYFEEVAARDISQEYAERISEIMWEHYKLATQRKPEFMGFNHAWDGRAPINDPEFSLWNHGDKVQERIEEYRNLRTTVEGIYSELDSEAQTPFFELVYFPVASAANINEKLLHAYKSRAYAAQGRVEANYHADLAEEAYNRRVEDHETYNKEIENGKWDEYIRVQPGPNGGPVSLGPPPVERVDLSSESSGDVSIEGSSKSINDIKASRSGSIEQGEINFTAEDASLTGEQIVRAEDDQGTYVGVPEGEGNQTEFPTDDFATFEFTLPEGINSDVTLYAEVTHATVENDSWYIQFDDRSEFLWNRTGEDDPNTREIEVLQESIDPGQHTLTFYAREDGAKLRGVSLRYEYQTEVDYDITLPRISGPLASFGPADASLTGEQIVRTEDDLGTYVGVPEGEGNQTEFPTDDFATFEFTVPEEEGGQYTLYAEASHPTLDSDSWFIQFDDESEPFLWNGTEEEPIGTGEFEVLQTTLEPGQHTLTFYAREDGPKLRGIELVRTQQGSNVLPRFNRYTQDERFIDLFKTGEGTVSWTAETSASWLNLSETSGTIDEDGSRIWANVDYEAAPNEANLEGYIDISSGDREFRVYATVSNNELSVGDAQFIESNGVIAMGADNYQNKVSGSVANWTPMEKLGRRGTAMMPRPLTGWYIDSLNEAQERSPVLEYDMMVVEGGLARLTVEMVPSYPLRDDVELRIAVSIDDQDPMWVTFNMGTADTPTWYENVSRNAIFGTVGINLEPGTHTLRVLSTDPSVNVNRYTIEFDREHSSYLGPDETSIAETDM